MVLSGSLRQAAGGLQLLSVTVTGRFELELQGVSVRNGRVEAAGRHGGWSRMPRAHILDLEHKAER